MHIPLNTPAWNDRIAIVYLASLTVLTVWGACMASEEAAARWQRWRRFMVGAWAGYCAIMVGQWTQNHDTRAQFRQCRALLATRDSVTVLATQPACRDWTLPPTPPKPLAQAKP